MSSEVANSFAVLHGRLTRSIVGARLPSLGDVRRRDLGDDILERRCGRLHATRTAHVSDGAEPNRRRERLLVGIALDECADGVEHSIAPEDLAVVREVDRRQLEPLARDVLPHVELRPVRDREDTNLLALSDARVVEIPDLRALRSRVPLAEVVTEAEDALLCPRTLLVAPRTAHGGVEAVFLERIEERRRLQLVA